MSTSEDEVKINVPIPHTIVGLVSVSGLNVTIATGKRFEKDVQNWLGQVERRFPQVKVTEASLTEVKSASVNDDTKSLIVDFNRRATDVGNSNLVKDALEIFDWANEANASDIYIDVNEESEVAVISRKVYGLIGKTKLEYRSQEAESIVATIYNVMCEGKERSNFSTNEPAFASIRKSDYLPESIHSIRFQSLVSDQGYGATLRLLPKKSHEGTLASLGYTKNLIEMIKMLMMRPKGGMLIVGGVGSGKSTTLQVMLSNLNDWHAGRKRIYTVEDPVEYPMDFAVQMGVVGSISGMSSDEQYANAVKILLRSAPDIGMVGEIRGKGTAAEFFRIASSGFKGLSTIHGNGCWAGIKRLHEELEVPMSYLTDLSIFNGCVTQQLLQTLCPDCKIPLEEAISKNVNGLATDAFAIRKQLELSFPPEMELNLNVFLHREGGCDKCDGLGYNGRTVIAEVVVCDGMMWEEFSKNGGASGYGWAAAEDYWRRQGGTSLLDNALQKIMTGEVDPMTTMREVGALNMTNALRDHSLSRSEIADAVSVFTTEQKPINNPPRPVPELVVLNRRGD